jgi:hypothetical protein
VGTACEDAINHAGLLSARLPGGDTFERGGDRLGVVDRTVELDQMQWVSCPVDLRELLRRRVDFIASSEAHALCLKRRLDESVEIGCADDPQPSHTSETGQEQVVGVRRTRTEDLDEAPHRKDGLEHLDLQFEWHPSGQKELDLGPGAPQAVQDKADEGFEVGSPDGADTPAPHQTAVPSSPSRRTRSRSHHLKDCTGGTPGTAVETTQPTGS